MGMLKDTFQGVFNEVYYVATGMLHSGEVSNLESGLIWSAAALGSVALAQGIMKNDRIEMGAAAIELSLALHRFRKIGEGYLEREWQERHANDDAPNDPNQG